MAFKPLKIRYSDRAVEIIKLITKDKKINFYFNNAKAKEYKYITLNIYNAVPPQESNSWCGPLYNNVNEDRFYTECTIPEFVAALKTIAEKKCLTIVP